MRKLHILACIVLVCTFSSCAHDLRVDRRVPYARPDGETLSLNVYQAKERPSTRLPAIVAIHGGAWFHGSRIQQWWYLHEFARRGYVVITVDYRKLPNYPFPYCLYDVKSAVRWMRLHVGQYGVDPDRIYAFGASAGGHLAAFLATSVPEDGFDGGENPGASSEISAAISLYGAVDLTKYRDPPEQRWVNPIWRHYVSLFVKDAGWWKYGQDPFVYVSPITYARPFSKPIFFVHGKDDSVVDFRQSQDAHKRLVELGVPTELMLFENRGHAFDYFHWRQRKQVFARMLEFLEDHGGAPAGTVFSHKAKQLPGIEDIPSE
jgi:acetyl esterase/lipase